MNKKFPIDPGDLADAAITNPKLADGSVTGAKVQNGSLGLGDLGFGLAADGSARTNAIEPTPGTFTTVALDSFRLIDGGSGVVSGALEVEDDIADQQPTKLDVRVLVDGIVTPTMVFTETIPNGATETTGILTPTMIGAGQHTISLQARLDNEATIRNRSLTGIIGPMYLPAV